MIDKYLAVASNTWSEMVTYRLNFMMWRVRSVMQLLTMYFLWLVVIPQSSQIFGYSQQLMLTYIIGVSFLSAIILSTRTQEIGDNIYRGDLSIFLVRPINYFLYWFWRDIGDKLFNISFVIIELFMFFLIVNPPFLFQKDILLVSLTVISVFIATVLYFLIGSLLGMIGFWSPEVWAPRFILLILLQFFAGSLFPLDILPKTLFNIFQATPFPYLLYFPLKIYLGQLSFHLILGGFAISIVWIFILFWTVVFVWQKGLKIYTAVGR